MMIAFASLFLGLVLGPRPVELVVGDGVAAVEWRLDGETVGRLQEPPWVLECDFGDELAPQLLEVVAFDNQNRELGQARQWLNLPQPQAMIDAVLEPHTPGEPRLVRLTWESSAGAEPEKIAATLDGNPLTVGDPHRLVLPQVDESVLHLLQVEMKFEGRVTSKVDLTFGGAYVDEVSTEMTALPIWATGKTGKNTKTPSLAEIKKWFVKDGEPLRVIAVEKGQAEIVVVMARPFPLFFEPGARVKVPKDLQLSTDLGVRFINPAPQQNQGVATTFNLFPISPAYDRGVVEDLYNMLTRLMRGAEKNKPNLSAAVAVAGLAAYEGRRRRAVALVLPSKYTGSDNLQPDQVRRYLDHLRVPLYVWNPESKVDEGLGTWGQIQPANGMKKLASAYTEITQNLDRQWIVWLDGQHLPQDISLAPAVRGFALTPP